MSRQSISTRLRYAILERDGYRCRYCGATAGESRLHIDHRMPVSKGGTNDPSNLVTACDICNLGKHAFTPTRLIVAQREHAMAADIFMRVCERYGDATPFWQAFCVILDLCLAEPDLEAIRSSALGAETYEAAEHAMFVAAGYPNGRQEYEE